MAASKSGWNALAMLVVGGALAGCLPGAAKISGGGPSVPAEVNSPPVISGTPATQAAVGTMYAFQPSASDNDGDTLNFSATGLPAWATINPQTGRVQGTPGDANVGTTSNIVVRVSDSSTSVSLPAFSITVVAQPVTPAPPPPATGTAALSWALPTQYTDGSTLPMNDLLGYRVYHGNSASSLAPYHDVDGPTNTSYEARQLGAGEHCFAVSAISVTNVESALSTVGCKRI